MCLVFGGSGLVGNALKNIRSDWTYLGSKDGDLRIMKNCETIFEKYEPTQIIFLAAIVGGLYKNLDTNYEMYIDNMKMQMNIIECCNKYKVKEGIFCLSTCIFPDKVLYPIKEEYLHNGEPHSSNYGYAFAKRNMDIMCRLSNARYKSNFRCIVPTNIYGEFDNFNLNNGHVIPSLIHKAYLAKKNNEAFVLRGSGKALRQFIYSGDVAKIIILLLRNRFLNYQNIILSPKKEVSIGEIGNIIAKNFEIEKVEYDDSYSDGQYKKTCDNSRLLEMKIELTSLEDGLEDTIVWFKNNYPNIRKL